MEDPIEETKVKETAPTAANLTWVEKYRPKGLQELISHEGKQNLFVVIDGPRNIKRVHDSLAKHHQHTQISCFRYHFDN